MTPRIGITGIVRQWDGVSRTGVNSAYVESVLRAGGVPVILSPLIGAARAAAAVEGVDGLLLTGGEDVDPSLYGATPSPRLGTVDRSRDLFELAALKAARERLMPVLGICRGIQLINVAFEGTLWQDLPSERAQGVDHNPKTPRDVQSHGIRVAAGSRAAAALGRTEFEANSIHHQAVRELGTGLVATAWASDGLIEAVEGPAEGSWLLAVQWHPEEMSADVTAPHGGIFRALVAEATRHAGSVRAEVPENAIG
ncbi:MAG: gamma-glutamyl-gamma-aminobutyrate hydrolase family protein [Bacillota bacterium]|jgi:putative glutamine amidotransferase